MSNYKCILKNDKKNSTSQQITEYKDLPNKVQKRTKCKTKNVNINQM